MKHATEITTEAEENDAGCIINSIHELCVLEQQQFVSYTHIPKPYKILSLLITDYECNGSCVIAVHKFTHKMKFLRVFLVHQCMYNN